MTMPGFEQAKEDWLSHDDWQYADRDACWKFFYSAGQSDGKAIPMKYRRMEFNAQLQAELAALHAEITCEEKRFSDLWESYCAKCADNEQLREALSLVRKYRVADSDAWVGKVDKALSTKPDNSVLREHEAQLLEKVIAIYNKDRVESEPDVAGWLENIVSEIRGGKFK